MRVKLSPLKLEDEGAYSCEITYEEPGRWFKDSCLDPQLTMLNVLGKPESVIVSMNNGTELEDGAILGPYTEGTNLVLRCKASGGRPIPEVRTIPQYLLSNKVIIIRQREIERANIRVHI